MRNSKVTNNIKGVSDLSLKGKIGFFSAILISINSTIGAGIFFKTNTIMANSGNSIIFLILSWVIAIFGIICMGLAICEISSASVGNSGINGWCKKFSNKYIYSASKNFMIYVYAPLLCFFTPIYSFKYIQDFLTSVGVANNNFGTSFDWLIWSFIALAIVGWLFFSSGLSYKMANIQSWIMTGIKFVPIVATMIIGIYVFSAGGYGPTTWQTLPTKAQDTSSVVEFFKLTPFVGLFGSLSAIIFSYGGFYSIVGIRNEMKEPKRNGSAIVVSTIVISVIYLIIAMIITFTYTDGQTLFGNFVKNHGAFKWVVAIMNLLIAIGTLGIVNGAIVFSTGLVKNLIETGEISVPYRLLNKFSKIESFFSAFYVFIVYFILFVILSLIGGQGYFPSSNELNEGGTSRYDASGYSSMASLINFANVISTWALIIMFGFICIALFGAMKKWKTNPLPTNKKRFFFLSWVSIVIISVSTLFLVIEPIANVILLSSQANTNNSHEIIGNSLVIFLLVFFVFVSFAPIFLEKKYFAYRLHFLQNLLTFTTRMELDEINRFIQQNNQQKRELLHALGIKDPYACRSIMHCQWNRLLKNKNEQNQFNTNLNQNILKLNDVLTYLK